jgi:DNA repair exonuclease SbcCD ATPase subunit
MIRNLKIDWQYLDSIYLKQQSILQYMEERLEKIKGEKERLIEKERLSYRLLDYYGENEYFTGEPLLENLIDNWKNQFHLLELGTKYIEKIADEFNKDIEKLYTEYPLWPLVAITSEGELDKLYKKIESQSRKLISPIIVLSQEEATKIILGKTNIEERYIYPSIWRENIDKKKFQIWKEELLLSAKEIVEERKNKEKEEKDWHDRLKGIKEFLSNYPYDEYSQLEENQRKLKGKLEDKRNKLEEKQIEDENINNEINEYETKLKNLDQESRYLERKMERALEFFQREREIEKINNQLLRKDEEIERINKDIELNEKNIRTSEDIVRSIGEGIRDIDGEISKILGDSNYKEVKDFESRYKNMEKESILEDREYIKDMLSEKQKDRPGLERQLKTATENKGDKIQVLELKYKSAYYPVDEALEYPYSGKVLKKNLVNNIIILREELEKIEPNKNKMEKIFGNKDTEYNIRKNDFYKISDEIMSFIEPLLNVKKQISKEKIELEDKEKYLKSNFDRLEKELKDIESHIQNLKVENGKYEFLVNKIKPILLQSDTIQNLPYNRENIISSIIAEMEELKINLESQAKKVNMEKNHFIQFLNENPIEIRLREMAISGVKNKEDFHEILEWQSNMERTLNRVVKIYEKNMMEHDKELNQFIQYLYTYLSTLAYEISTIPKNTKVKIEDKWKEIYQIQVPSWNEDRGKEEIRKHVDWMVSKLEDGEFLDEEGNEDIGKVKRSIETWLQPKQLLNIIMLGEELKVRCRKVTNDGKVSNMYYSWSSSNQWSGGEKWSKNMALFLGILNYAAEKKQHIVPNQKRNRTVIMDNPFGKASSDHVLSPVFFIAEQLGFQFIVLTAHGDGRFIRDYFPIVYSCKLRPSVEGDTSILAKEKIINYAFFRDNNPMTIERIGDREQLNLF